MHQASAHLRLQVDCSRCEGGHASTRLSIPALIALSDLPEDTDGAVGRSALGDDMTKKTAPLFEVMIRAHERQLPAHHARSVATFIPAEGGPARPCRRNVRAGHLPPPEADGRRYLKLPVDVL